MTIKHRTVQTEVKSVPSEKFHVEVSETGFPCLFYPSTFFLGVSEIALGFQSRPVAQGTVEIRLAQKEPYAVGLAVKKVPKRTGGGVRDSSTPNLYSYPTCQGGLQRGGQDQIKNFTFPRNVFRHNLYPLPSHSRKIKPNTLHVFCS